MKIETILIINANINEVWKKLADFEKYAEWNQCLTVPKCNRTISFFIPEKYFK